jgi:hypothetical protein
LSPAFHNAHQNLHDENGEKGDVREWRRNLIQWRKKVCLMHKMLISWTTYHHRRHRRHHYHHNHDHHHHHYQWCHFKGVLINLFILYSLLWQVHSLSKASSPKRAT